MQAIEPITIINVDDVPHAVSDMSPEVKRLVDFYNDWRTEEAQLKGDTLKVQAAMRDLSREIITTIRREKEQADAEQAAIVAAQEKEALEREAAIEEIEATDETETQVDDADEPEVNDELIAEVNPDENADA